MTMRNVLGSVVNVWWLQLVGRMKMVMHCYHTLSSVCMSVYENLGMSIYVLALITYFCFVGEGSLRR